MSYLISIITLALLTLPVSVSAKVKVVASTADLAYFARIIGGEAVEAVSIAAPTADLHYVEARPSYMVKLRDADLVLEVGLELDAWMDRLIDGSRNSKLKKVECSKYVTPVEVPTFKADASHGDLHRFGNPHYWISPANVEPILRAILEGLCEVDPADAGTFTANRDRFVTELNAQLPALKELAAPLAGKEIITYHNSWPYFAEFFGIKLAGFVEKYAGVAPSPAHMSDVINLIKHNQIKAIAMEPYFEHRVPDRIAAATGARVVVLYPSIGGRNPNESYFEWLRSNINALLEAEQ